MGYSLLTVVNCGIIFYFLIALDVHYAELEEKGTYKWLTIKNKILSDFAKVSFFIKIYFIFMSTKNKKTNKKLVIFLAIIKFT